MLTSFYSQSILIRLSFYYNSMFILLSFYFHSILSLRSFYVHATLILIPFYSQSTSIPLPFYCYSTFILLFVLLSFYSHSTLFSPLSALVCLCYSCAPPHLLITTSKFLLEGIWALCNKIYIAYSLLDPMAHDSPPVTWTVTYWHALVHKSSASSASSHCSFKSFPIPDFRSLENRETHIWGRRWCNFH